MLTELVNWSTKVLAVVAVAAVTSALTVTPDSIPFDKHDIGTTTSKKLTLTNASEAAVDISLQISGKNPEDFSWRSACLKHLPPKGQCEITALFRPFPLNPVAEVRSATMEVSDGATPKQILLSGSAFENLSASPASLEFKDQPGNASSTQKVELTNYSVSQVSGIDVAVTGDFTEDHSGCGSISPGKACTLYVNYSPKQSGAPTGSLTVTGNLTDGRKLTRVVMLYAATPVRAGAARGWSRWVLPIVGLVYFLALVLVRWNMIAKPARAQIVAEIEVTRSWVNAETAAIPDSKDKKARIDEIHRLLSEALYPFTTKRSFVAGQQAPAKQPPYPLLPTRILSAMFWTQGWELAGRTLAHEADLELIALLPIERVRARLEIAAQELRELDTPVALALSDRIHESLASGEALILEQARQLLQQLQMVLKPLSAPEAARQAWLADLQIRSLTALQQLTDWIHKNTSAVGTLEDCQSRLRAFQDTAKACQDLAADLGRVSTLPNNSDPLNELLERISVFAQELAKTIQAINALLANEHTVLEDCKTTLDSLGTVGTNAEKLAEELKKAALPDRAASYQALLGLGKSQVNLVAAMKQASLPSPSVSLLQDLIVALQQQTELIQELAPDIATCRAVVLRLSLLPRLSPDLITRIISAVSGESSLLDRWRALLVEAAGLLYYNADNSYFQLGAWHNKLMWLVGCALLLMAGLGLTLHNAILFLVGAVGGLLSRLQRTVDSSDIATYFGANWGALFLSPLTGALSAWSGILLIILAVKLHILGAALSLDWHNPAEPTALAIAILFGFSERWFDGLAGQLQGKIAPAPSLAAAPAVASPKPLITSVTPSSGVIGKEIKLTVRGANFQSGATVTLTDDAGKPAAAKMEYKDSNTVIVTWTPTGTKDFSATLSISNPDKQSATIPLSVKSA